MFGPKHYIPILRWKQAERFALRNLLPDDRKSITPLIEFTPDIFRRKGKQGQPTTELDTATVLSHQAKNLLEACGNDLFFLDLGYVAGKVVRGSGTKHAIEYLAELGRSYKLAIVPVTSLLRTHEYQSSVARIIKEDGRGICLRITPVEVLAPAFSNELQTLLGRLRLNLDLVHLIVDYGASDPSALSPESVFDKLPNRNDWGTVSVAMGAFPPDLQAFQPGNNKIPRSDYLAWKKAVSQEHGRLRKPSFSDYTIQYGLYKEPPENCNPSISVRYTLEEEVANNAGEAKRAHSTSKKTEEKEVRPGREQYNAHAQILCDNQELFYGGNFSWGDAFIREKSMNTKEHGSPEIWLRAGINHHMTVVCRQIASFPVP